MRAAASVSSGAVRGVLLPLTDAQLLVPNAAVAEIINYQSPQSLPDAPAWLKGHLAWRGEIIPLVSAESLLARSESVPGRRARIVVCNSLGKSSRMPYYGVVIQALPRLIRVAAEDLSSSGEGGDMTWVLAQVAAAGTEALIPDLDALEQALLDQLHF